MFCGTENKAPGTLLHHEHDGLFHVYTCSHESCFFDNNGCLLRVVGTAATALLERAVIFFVIARYLLIKSISVLL